MSSPFTEGINLNNYLLAPDRIAADLRIDEKEAARLIRREMAYIKIGGNLTRVERAGYREWQWRQTHTRAHGACNRKCVPVQPDVDCGDGTVYFIEAVGANRIKIGWTGSLDARGRLRGLQTASPFELGILFEMPGTWADEQALHRRFRDLRVSPTTEWFHAHDDLWDFMLRSSERRECTGASPFVCSAPPGITIAVAA